MSLPEPQPNTRPLVLSVEIVAAACIAVVFVVWALSMPATRTGDGHYYYAMVEGLAKNGSPAITDAVRETVRARVNVDPLGLTMTAKDGSLYPVHFFAYPLVCVPAYKVLGALGLDSLKAFQLTNAVLITVAVIYVLVFSPLPAVARWFITAGFLLSTGTIYFRWTHPEVFSAALVLMASVAFVMRRYVCAALLAALGSLQNPSVALLIPAIVAGQAWELRSKRAIGFLHREMLAPLGKIVAVSSLAMVPYLWNLQKFGVLSPIVAHGFIDHSLIGLQRLWSFLFDLNQGLILGLPLLLWAVPVAVITRVIAKNQGRSGILRLEDLLLVGFLLMVLPTLAQVNWNGGCNIFMRYGAWAGMVPLVWVAVTVSNSNTALQVCGVVPAMALQVAMALLIGGVSINRSPSYLEFMPWVVRLWSRAPHFYDPLPEIFFERLVGREASITTPAVLHDSNNVIVRVLTRNAKIQPVAEEVCGPGTVFVAADGRYESGPRIRDTERGYRYVTGRFICYHTLPVTMSAKAGAVVRPRLLNGWSSPEEWGTWSINSRAALHLNTLVDSGGKVGVLIRGHAYVNDQHPQQQIELLIDGQIVDAWAVKHPEPKFERMIVVDAAMFRQKGGLNFEFHLPDSISPKELGISSDTRSLGFGLWEIHVEQISATADDRGDEGSLRSLRSQ
jgi:hypothetical protein